jgi:cytochrome c5
MFSISPNRSSGITFSDSTISASSDSLNQAEGKKLYRSKCKKCHELYSPKDYKLRIWKENLEEMRYKAELSDKEYDLIFLYLKENCKK